MTIDNDTLALCRSQNRMTWEGIQECLGLLKHAGSKAEYAIIFDLNGFMDNPYVPQVFKNLRKKIG